MKLDRLYRKNKDSTVSFVDISTRKINKSKDSYKLTTSKGIVNKTKTIDTTKTINLGKKTIEEHLSKLVNELGKEGYKSDYQKVLDSNWNTFDDDSLMPMLLEPVDVDKVSYPCYAQRKYDGMRCISEISNDGLKTKSRENTPIDLPHITEQINKIYKQQLSYQFDGELYIHGVDLGDMLSIKKQGDPSKILQYVIYDIPIKGLTFYNRRNLLQAIDLTGLDNIKVDYGVEINNKEELLAFYNRSLKSEYEGIVVCDPNGTYDFGFRTKSKCKVKPRETDEFLCIGHYFNKGKMEKQSTLICKINDKYGEGSFHVKMKGTAEQREQWALEFEDKFLNKMITVEYRKISKYGKPIEAVGIAVRDYE